MAIQLPNPGLGDGQTGDNEYVMWTKVKDNFSNTSHAASRLVGTGNGQIPLVENIAQIAGAGAFKTYSSHTAAPLSGDLNNLGAGEHVYIAASWGAENKIPDISAHYVSHYFGQPTNSLTSPLQLAFSIDSANIYNRRKNRSGVYSNWGLFYTSANTTREAGTGYIKTSSPVLNLLHNDFEKVHEAEQLDIKVENPKTGVYRISGTTGLRKNDGWYFSPPKDEHNNVLCMVEVEEDGDVVVVKTYKKKFDFETVSIVPDYDNPTNIPDEAIVMLRFNDLPQEQLDEPVI